MARARRRPSAPLIERLYEEPWRFDVYQAARILEEVRRAEGLAVEPLGEGEDPEREALRFVHEVSFAFPASALKAVEPPRRKSDPARVTQAFIGLAGALGPLPRPVSERVIAGLKRGDGAFAAFLDIVNHRLASLMVRAKRKHRVALDPVPPGDSHFAGYLFALMGLGLAPLRDRMAVEDRALLRHAGLIVARPRSAVGLERLVADQFAVPARVEPFDGAWHAIPAGQLTRLGARAGANAALGRDAVLGPRYWDQQTGLVLRLGPLSFDRFLDFLPGARDGTPEGEGFAALKPLVAFYAGLEYAVRVTLVCAPEERPAARLTARPDGARDRPGMRLGWTSWLGPRPRDGRAPEASIRLRAAGGA